MSGRHWSKVQPKSLRHAMELCLDHARAKHNRSVDSVAEMMGEVNKWTFYKWMETGGLPTRFIKPFEMACGINFVTRWLVISDGKLVLEIPTGRVVGVNDIQTLQASAHEAIGALIRFYNEQADAQDTLAAVQTALERMAWHKINVEKFQQPEIPFDEEY